MKVWWKDEFLGDWSGAPTLQEMIRIKRDLGPEFKNPLKFMAAATGIVEQVPVLDSNGQPKLDKDGKPVVENEASDAFDPEAMCMWLAVMYSRPDCPANPQRKKIYREDIDGTFDDLRIELDADEQAQVDGEPAGKADAESTTPSTSNESSTNTAPGSPDTSA